MKKLGRENANWAAGAKCPFFDSAYPKDKEIRCACIKRGQKLYIRFGSITDMEDHYLECCAKEQPKKCILAAALYRYYAGES